MINRKPKNALRDQYNSTIFTQIYKKNIWGGKRGSFYSGTGSHNEYISNYAKVVTDFIVEKGLTEIVEIGCGDFNVSKQILNMLSDRGHTYSYTGYDVVKQLIDQNNKLYGSPQINFIRKDSCVGRIKGGDLLLVRQVIQHLNNNSIMQIVKKFDSYKHVIVTEHQASSEYTFIIPNLDKKTGPSNRVQHRSGVYLDKAPFNCKIEALLFSIPERVMHYNASINTFLISNN